jgi:type II secretory pathway pseudopilin PulG
MTIRRTMELIAFAIAILIAAMAAHAWLASRDEQRRLATTLSQQKQLLEAADARERTRQSALSQTLAKIENLKRTTKTPQQIVKAIPQYVPLPQPITLMSGQQGTTTLKDSSGESERRTSEGVSDGPVPQSSDQTRIDCLDTVLPSAPAAQIPSADLKPLFDYIQDCRACQAQLAVAKQNAADDASKIAALTKQRDAAITATKGGTTWCRLRRNALWFAIGVTTTLAANHFLQAVPQPHRSTRPTNPTNPPPN